MSELILSVDPASAENADVVQTVTPHKVRFGLVTPVRDEEAFIGAMIESVAAQTILPLRWIIVDDGSRDKSAEIIREYARHHEFIRLMQLPVREDRHFGGECAASIGLRELAGEDLDFVARFDADLLLPPDHFARIIEECLANPKLGIAGGGLYIERNGTLVIEAHSLNHVRGALKIYRRRCFEELGGLAEGMGWDTLDEVTARVNGWETRTFECVQAVHLRPTGQATSPARLYHARGRAEFLTWSDPVFVLGKAIKIAVTQASAIKPICYLLGFLTSYAGGARRAYAPAIARARRAEQWHRIATIVSHPLAGNSVEGEKRSSSGCTLCASTRAKQEDPSKMRNGKLCPGSR